MSLEPKDLTDLGPAEFAALVKKTPDADFAELFAGPARQKVLDGVFATFPKVFNAAKAAGADARINWRITGAPDGGSDTYAVVVKDGECTIEKSPEAEPNTSVMIAPADFLKLITGNGNPMMMFMSGKVKARGDVPLLMQLQNWFSLR